MSNRRIYFSNLVSHENKPVQSHEKLFMERDSGIYHSLPASITRSSSKQTYYTIRFLVDRDRLLNAYRAYAYFRWVDDSLDEKILTREERVAFLKRQQALIDCFYQEDSIGDLVAEETILMDLIRSDHELNSGLQTYIQNMMAVMAFDVARRGRVISQHELTEYSGNLSTAVTEALHYFIGHEDPSPQIPTRYLAVTGAHLTHMLRDSYEDAAAGYFNVPCEFLETHKLNPCDINNDAYRAWVKNRVQLARVCFRAGKSYLSQVRNLRYRIAGYAYIARFEVVLNIIEQEKYQLRGDYPERKGLGGGLKMCWLMLSMFCKDLVRGKL